MSDDGYIEPIEPDYDPETLREVYDDPAAARARAEELRTDVLTAEDTTAELLARADLVDLLLGLGETDEALIQAQQAADRADIAGTAGQQHLARIRLARAFQYSGDFGQATALFTELEHASQMFGPVVEAYTVQAIGANDYDQGLYSEARHNFGRALMIRQKFELPEAAIKQSQLAFDAASRHEDATR